MKDKMSNGNASWIYYVPREGEKDTSSWQNPWEASEYRYHQFEPIMNSGGTVIFRKCFDVSMLKDAKVSATALGVFDLWCNGRRVGRKTADGMEYDEMKPGYTDYNSRALYYTYDLTDYLTDGKNTIMAAVVPGWYTGKLAYKTCGEGPIAFIAKISVSDGSGERDIYTDDTWQGLFGSALRASDIYDGEIYDARYPSFAELSRCGADVEWKAVEVMEKDISITPHIGPTVKVRPQLERRPISVTVYDGTVDNGGDYGKINIVGTRYRGNGIELKKGETVIFDLGQNMVGFPVFDVCGARGTSLQVRVAEMLNDSGRTDRGNDNAEGSLYTINYRDAMSKGYYVIGSNKKEKVTPIMTFYGFRYFEISATDDITIFDPHGEVVGSDTRETGSIVTSHKDVNQLISNIIWGQRGNYLSIPTDCPQRDERLGWTGDTQVFCTTAAYNADVRLFFHKWMQDMRDGQFEDGSFNDVCPRSKRIWSQSAAWTEAAVIVPYMMWKMYGDTEILSDSYESMEKFMAWLETTQLMGAVDHYGDWLAYEETDKRLVSVAYFAYTADLMAKICEVLGHGNRVPHYMALSSRVKENFRKLYCGEDGRLLQINRTQAVYSLCIAFSLLDESLRDEMADELKKKIVENDYTLSTGFIGTYFLPRVLSDIGADGLAYSLLLQTKDPSWLYSVHQGATTIWERWNSYTIKDGFGDVGMNSFNHYAYGAVEEWMYRYMAGIECKESDPGFSHIYLQPRPDTRTDAELPHGQERITWIKAEFDSPVGLIKSSWSTENGFVYEAEIPARAKATLTLPILSAGDTLEINGTEHKFTEFECANGKAEIKLDGGKYIFKQK